jgi:hypothetical protein
MLTGGAPTNISWFPLSDRNAPSLAISSLAIDPTDSNTLWAGTGSLTSATAPGGGGQPVGLLKCTNLDNIPSWTWLGKDLAGSQIVSVVPTKIFAPGTFQQVVLVATLGSGIRRSIDGGRSFSPFNTAGLPTGKGTDLIADPLVPDRFYAAVVGFGGGSNSGVFESIDSGADWTEIDNGTSQMTGAGNLKLAVQAIGGQTLLFVATGDQSGNMSGAFDATVAPGGGVGQWQQLGSVPIGVPQIPNYTPPEDLFGGHFAAAADPTQSGVFYIAGYQGNAIFRVSSGPSWAPLDSGYNGLPSLVNNAPHVDERHLAFLGTSLLVGNDGGIYGLDKPSQAGASGYAGLWTALNGGMRVTELYSATFDPSKGVLFGGAQDNDAVIQASSDPSTPSTWQPQTRIRGINAPVAAGGDGFQTAIDAGNNEYFVANSTLYRNGTTVSLAGLNTADFNQFNSGGFGGETIAASPLFSNRIMVGYTALYESTDGGNTVNAITLPGQNPGALITYNGSEGQVIAYGPDSPVPISLSLYEPAYVGDNAGQLWVRTPVANFSQITVPWANPVNVVSIAVDPNDYRYAYVLLGNGQVWETTGAGLAGSWTQLDGNASAGKPPKPGSLATLSPSLDTLAIYTLPGSSGGQGTLLAGGLGGVFQYLGSEKKWFDVGGALPNVLVTDLHYVPQNSQGTGDFLLAATLGRGAWELRNDGSFGQARTLQINADEASGKNTVVLRLDPNNSNLMQVLINNQDEWGDKFSYFSNISITATHSDDEIDIEYVPPALDAITIHTQGGANTVNIAQLPANIQMTVQSNGSATVSVGSNGSMQSILGTIEVSNTPGNKTALYVNDQNDTTAYPNVTLSHNPIVNVDTISGYGSGQILFGRAYVDTLTITAGTGASTFNLQSTGAYDTTIDDRGGNNINIGNQGDTQRILGSIFLENFSGLPSSGDTVIVDDSADTTSSPYTVSLDNAFDTWGNEFGVVVGLTANDSLVQYDPANVRRLIVKTPAVNNTVNIDNIFAATYLVSGGNRLLSDGVAGDDRVIVGPNGSVQGIRGDLYIENPNALDSVQVDNSADPATNRQVMLSSYFPSRPIAPPFDDGDPFGRIGGLAPGTINYELNDTNSDIVIKGGGTLNALGTTWTVTGGADSQTTRLTTGPGHDIVNLEATAAPFYLNGAFAASSATVTLGAPSGTGRTMQQILGDVHVSFGPGSIAILDDSADTTGVSATMDRFSDVTNNLPYERIQGLSGGGLVYLEDGMDSHTIDGGTPSSGKNVFNIAGTPTETTTILQTGTGQDDVNVLEDEAGGLIIKANSAKANISFGNAGLLQPLFGTAAVYDLQGKTNVVVDDALDTATHSHVTLTGNTLDGLVATFLSPWLKYSNLSSLTIHGGVPASGKNTFSVLGTAAGTSTTLSGGNSDFNFGSDPANLQQSVLDPIQGPVAVNGAGSNTTVNFNDKGGTPGAAPNQVYNYSLAQNTFSRTGTATVTFGGIATVNLNAANAGGSGYNVLGVSSTAPGTTYNVYAGTGLNEFLVFDLYYTLNGIHGPLNLHGTSGFSPNDDLVEIDDVDKTTGHALSVNAGASAQSGLVQRYNASGTQTDAALISYDGLNAYAVLYTAGSAGHTINVQSNASDLLTIIGAGVTDTVNVGNSSHILAAIQGDLRIQGDKPTVNVDDAGDTNSHTDFQSIKFGSDGVDGYLVTGLLPQSSVGGGHLWFLLDPAAPVSIKTGTGDDVFQVHDFNSAPAISIDAEPVTSTRSNMHNKLDYSAYSGPVKVVLTRGVATGFASVSHIQDVTGGNGNNLIVGSGAPGVFIGGAGRNILISGAGGGTLDASGSSGDNILIAGTTDYDTSLTALDAIFAEWTRTDLKPTNSYRIRFGDLSTGIMVNGQTIVLNSTTVHADSLPTTLKGSTQTDPTTGKRAHNWFFDDADTDDTIFNFLNGWDHRTRLIEPK